MLEISIGFAVMYLLQAVRGKGLNVEGMGGIFLALLVSYGIGSLILLLLRH